MLPPKTEIAAINKIMFFQNVCQLVKTHASPKQPQSDTGLAKARYRVSGVIKIISNKANHVAVVFRMPKTKRYLPKIQWLIKQYLPAMEKSREPCPHTESIKVVLYFILRTQWIDRLRKS